MGQVVITCSAVCSFVPHSQAAVEVIPHLCVSKRNRPMPIRRRSSVTHKGLGKIIPGAVGLASSINVWSRELFSCHFMLSYIPPIVLRRRRRLKGIHSRSDTNRTGAEGLSFYYPRLLHCLNQMLEVMSLSQHRVSSSKTIRPRASCGARCIGHAVSTSSAVCSETPHSQFGEGARPHLCMDEWNCPTPVRRRLSLTQATRGKPIPTFQKYGAWKHFHSTPFSICDLSIQRRGCQVWQGCPRDSAKLAQTGV